MKKVFTTLAMACCAVTLFAGGLLTNTNQHAAFVRNPMRYASLDIDAVYFNPAGTAFLQDGWHLSGNWQMIWQDRDVISFNDDKKYRGEVYVPCLPTVMAAYKTDRFTFSGFFGVPGGGGKCEFADGLPSFNSLASAAADGLPGSSEFTSKQYVFSLQLGVSMELVKDYFSAYAGVRGNYTTANYEGSIAAMYDEMPMFGIDLDMNQTGLAFAPILGLDYKFGDFNFAVKYEFRAITFVQNDTKKLDATIGDTIMSLKNQVALNEAVAKSPALGALVGFTDGNILRSDAPAILSLAGSYKVLPRLQIMAGWNYYFDKDAKVESLMGGDNMTKISKNTTEYLFGAEFKVTEKFLVSAGVQFTDFGITDRYAGDLSFINDSFMTGLGGKYNINDKIDLNFGYCYANYAPDNNEETFTRYERKTHNVAVGVDIRL